MALSRDQLKKYIDSLIVTVTSGIQSNDDDIIDLQTQVDDLDAEIDVVASGILGDISNADIDGGTFT